MPIPPKKLKAFVDEDKKNAKNAPPEDEEMEGDEEEGGEEQEEGGADEGADENGDKHLSEEEMAAMLEKAENEVANGPDGALSEAMAGYDGSGEPPPGFDADLWEAACEIVGCEDYQGDADPFLVAAHVYKHLGGEVDSGEGGDEMPPEDEDAGDEAPAPQFDKGGGKFGKG